MRFSTWVTTGIACLILAGACTVADPAESVVGVGSPTPVDSRGPDATGTDRTGSLPIAEPDDPTEELFGRAVEALGDGGIDVVMRIGAEGFRLPEHEVLLDVHGDRVLSARTDPDGGNTRLIVRDLAGAPLREIDTGMQIPQTAIVRAEDVYFGGADAREDDDGLVVTDRGAWVARGEAPPEQIVAANQGPGLLSRYNSIRLSPDGLTVGISRCGEEACATILMRQGSPTVEIPKPGLIALTNEVALVIGQFSDVTAYAIADGAELWRANTDGVYYDRYATADGARIVMSSIEDAGDDDGNSTDQLRLEVMDARTGVVERTVLLSTDDALLWVAPSLSSDRYVAILDSILPNADEGPHVVHIVDLDAGRLLDVELMLGGVP
jgi:hypothetical protein